MPNHKHRKALVITKGARRTKAMANEDKATPRPWRVVGVSAVAIHKADTPYLVADCGDRSGSLRERREADAALIVRAVNALDAVEGLRKASRGLRTMVENVLTDSQLDHPHCGATIRNALTPFDAALAALDAALAPGGDK